MSSASYSAISDDLQALSAEVKKKFPEIKDAVDKALTSLKAVKDGKISATAATPVVKGDKVKDKEKEKANNGLLSDLLAPYILTCNHADAAPKVVGMAMSGMQLLINNDLIAGSDVKNILRVLSIQVTSGKSEQQVKLLQIILQLITLLSKNTSFSKHLTESTISSFLSLSFQLCGDRGSVSVSSTAMTTARQVVSIILDCTHSLFFGKETLSADSPIYTTPPDMIKPTSQQESSSFYVCSLNILKDISLLMKCSTGEWLRSVELPQSFALDLIYHSLSGWKTLFLRVPEFHGLIKDSIFPSLKLLLQELQLNYIYDCTHTSVSTAAALTSRIVRIGRCFLLNYITPNTIEETGILVTLLAHSLQPDRGDNTDTIRTRAKRSGSIVVGKSKTTNIFEDAGALLKGGVGGIMSSLNIPLPKASNANNSTNSNATNGANLKDSNCMLELSSSKFPGFGSGPVEIPAHSGGVCLETLLSFFLSDIPHSMIHDSEGITTLCSAMLVVMLNASTIISGGITKKTNIAEFDSSVKGSKLISLIESVLVGKEVSTSSSIKSVVDSVHDLIMESASITPAEVLILAVQLMQVITRLLVKLSIYSQSSGLNASVHLSSEVSSQHRDVIMFLPHHILSSKFSLRKQGDDSGADGSILVSPMNRLCDEVYDAVQEACVNLLVNIKSAGIVKRSIGILSEVALISGLLGLHRPCEHVVSSLCKFTVPKWHGHELLEANSKDMLKLRHIQACGRLMQIIHVIADAISDWDTIIDAFEQVARFTIIASNGPAITNVDGSPSSMNGDIEKIMISINKFKKYTVFLSDEAFVKLITSLVALSMNSLAATTTKKPSAKAKSSSSATAASAAKPAKTSKNIHCSIPYMADAVPANLISFALQSAIEISKNNIHRLSTVWQMLTSHLRMVASSKTAKTRAIAVAATQDIVISSLEFKQKPNALCVDSIASIPDDTSSDDYAARTVVTISDEIVYNKVMPTAGTSFEPRDFHKKVLIRRLNNPAIAYAISQPELLNSLNILSSIRYDDVRIDIMTGLLRLLQGKGDIIAGEGWGSVIDLLSTVAASMPASTVTAEGSDDKNNDNDKSVDYDDDIEGAANKKEKPWPVVTLRSAFDCMKLIVDEFLDIMPVSAIKSVIVSLSYFAAQAVDVNISLTSVEMLWKVGDLSLTTTKGAVENTITKADNASSSCSDADTESVLEVMMQRLLVLSTDGRPEVRNCGMNTLFSAMTANAQLLSSLQWKQVFDDVIFPLFERTGERSKRAARSKEAAKAPELRKGVRMAVHHSRDTAHKQWSETRSIALKGLARVVRTCTKSLLLEFWFKETWESSIEICTGAIQAALVDMEVANAAVDVLFSMMKMVAITTTRNSSSVNSVVSSPARKASLNPTAASIRDDEEERIVAIEVAREELWKLAWLAVRDIASFDCPLQELPMHICQQMISLYTHGEAGEFRYSENIRGLLDMIVLVARPRMVLDANTLQPVIPENHDRISEVRLYQSVMALLRLIKPGDIIAAGLLASSLCEISFASQHAFTSSFFDDQVTVYLAACPDKLRVDCADYLMSLIAPSPEADEPESTESGPIPLPKGSAGVILDVALRRFSDDISSPSIQARDSLVGLVLTRSETRSDRSMSDSEGGGTSSKKRGSVGGFFANIGKLLGNRDDSPPPASSSSSNDPSLRTSQFLSSLHKLDHFTVTSDLTSCIHSPNSVGDHKGNKWTTFIPLHCEFTVLASSLRLEACSLDDTASAIVSADGSVTMSDHSFGNLLSMVSCLMSPWRRCEIPLECFAPEVIPTPASPTAGGPSPMEYKSSIELMKITTHRALRHLLSPHVLNSLPQAWTLALFDNITASSRLAMHAIASGNVENFDLNATSVGAAYSESYFVEMLDLVRVSIRSILTNESSAAEGSGKHKNQASKRSALLTLMTILRDLCALAINPSSINIQSADVIYTICNAFLVTFSEIDASWGIMSRDFSVDRAASADPKALMGSWLQATHCTDSLSYSLPLPGSAGAVSSSSENTQISRKAHCLLFLPLIIKLSSQCGQDSIRLAASAIIEALNITSVVNSYMDLLNRNEMLMREQERMAQDMYSLKSANQLPF